MSLATPYLHIDLPQLRINVRRAADQAALVGVALRPHAKTHKSAEVARLQLAHGAVGLTVATVGEAEHFVRQGCRDVFIAFPVWVDEGRATRLRDLRDQADRLAIGVDSVESAGNAGRRLGHTGIEVLVEVDSGHHRTGVAPEQAGVVARAAQRAGLPVRGVFTFPGHGYGPGGSEAAAHDERTALETARDSIQQVGIEEPVLSGGSTPTLAASLTSRAATELRPGVYVFGDAQQWELGIFEPDDISLTVHATVVSHAGGRVVLDAGSKTLGADRAAYSSGYGRLLEHPEARIVTLSEHHAVVQMPGPRPALGSLVSVVPNHVCSAVNLADTFWVAEPGGLRAWPVGARGLHT
ncbi:alanine racemase [Nocardioides acrostichi]|uniref:alanine racemase n=1 Tax=Nocardioides acrostichi TaxID=2784339 RepID=UPI002E2B2BF7|nr:alanine racemase [Nocardioides acrostichi]